MYPHTHFLFPFFLGLLLSKFGILSWKGALLAGIIGVLIDLDHYVEHILQAKTDKFSLRATWNNSIKLHRFQQRSFIHDAKGCVLLTVLLVGIALFSWKAALAGALGYYSHLLLDFPSLRKEKKVREKVGSLYFRETYGEMVLDILLVVGIVVVLVL